MQIWPVLYKSFRNPEAKPTYLIEIPRVLLSTAALISLMLTYTLGFGNNTCFHSKLFEVPPRIDISQELSFHSNNRMPFTTKIKPYVVLLVVAAISLAAFVQLQEPRRNSFKAIHTQLCERGKRSLNFVCEEKLVLPVWFR